MELKSNSSRLLSSVIVLILISVISCRAENNEFDDPRALKLYKHCTEKNVACNGILGTDCIEKKYCEYIAAFTETYDSMIYETLNMLGWKAHRKMGILVGIAPFEKAGNNYTAKCKPILSAKDFRIVMYQRPGSELTDRFIQETSANGWDDILRSDWSPYSASLSTIPKISKLTWKESCEARLKEENRIARLFVGKPITPFNHASYPLILNDELFYTLKSTYTGDHFSDEDKLNMRNGVVQYNTTDNAIFMNFLNEVAPETLEQVAERSANTGAWITNSYLTSWISLTFIVSTWAFQA